MTHRSPQQIICQASYGKRWTDFRPDVDVVVATPPQAQDPTTSLFFFMGPYATSSSANKCPPWQALHGLLSMAPTTSSQLNKWMPAPLVCLLRPAGLFFSTWGSPGWASPVWGGGPECVVAGCSQHPLHKSFDCLLAKFTEQIDARSNPPPMGLPHYTYGA